MSETCISASKLYEKDAKIKREDVKVVQNWLKKQPHLPQLLESQIAITLHSCYYSVEATKIAIEKYFTRRTQYPHIFNYPSEQTIRNTSLISLKKILPKKTPQGDTIFLSGLLDYKPENYNFLHEVAIVNSLLTAHILRKGFIEGLVVVFDLKGSTFGHLAKVNLSVLKQGLLQLQEGSPLRIKQIHIINVTPLIDKILALLKPFLSRKLFELIQVHSSVDSLFEYVPKECLPEDYGGDLPSRRTMTEETVQELLENEELLKWHDSQKIDESKRIEEINIGRSSFGAEGTFKRLEID